MEEQPPLTLSQIMEEYRRSIPFKIKYMGELANKLISTGSEDAMKQLRMEVHKLTGNAGSYGYQNVTLISQEFTKFLHKKSETLDQYATDPHWGEGFEEFLTRIKREFDLA